jgi:hypothetical protein
MGIRRAFADPRLSPFDKMIFAYLKNLAGIKKECWPSYEKIMKDCHVVSRTALAKCIKKLSSTGHVKVSKIATVKKRHNMYSFASTLAVDLQNEFLEVESTFASTLKTDAQNNSASTLAVDGILLKDLTAIQPRGFL